MKSSEYWEKRIANGTWTTYNNLEEKNRALLEMYQEASLNISDELYRVSEKMKTSTPTLSDMHKFDRLTKLQKNIESIIGELGENVEKFYIDNATQGFKEVYKNVRVALGETDFNEPPKKLMEQFLRKQWEGSNFSTRLWKNTQVLVTNLNDVVTNGLIQGKTVTEMAIQLNNRMNKEFNICHRLVRSETMHYLNESAKSAYKDAGCEKIQLWAAIDERTCPVCGVKHGNKYSLRDAPVLPLHANCRCTYIPIIDDDVANNSHAIAKEDVKKEWQRRSIPDEQIKDKMKKNYETDMKQYKKYKEVLGEELPKSFDKFQGLKYNNSEEWGKVKDKFSEVFVTKDFDSIPSFHENCSNLLTRKWYKWHDENIPNLIDTSKTIQEQARQAHELRNTYRIQARDLMKDQEERKNLDTKHPNPSFEELIEHKKLKYGLSNEEAYVDIIRSSQTTNKKYDKIAGIKEE
ncbi:phage putative head morphogenesis protein, SPP1 gp7 family [Clostridium amylolyticum]|uniref:Phage putative head morphogenesis protein, SPP1 gp7 family n=1 Tax=Clostridium amylolyticum TaxID=1121298 RepID=A0A1M6EY94_9CLOT|nr:minor capsid protein [Clostridium amylolyticum]SHI90424.1 phage putative head morphogenesis protein, SPP1 gp7 family [Clostridium amylolyticum]